MRANRVTSADGFSERFGVQAERHGATELVRLAKELSGALELFQIGQIRRVLEEVADHIAKLGEAT